MLSIRRNSKEKRQFKQLRADQIAANPNQPRKHFDPQAIQELADSIRLFGILNPLTVRETEQGYELIAGERRLRASQLVGLEQVPCYVLSATEEDSSLMAMVENLQRQNLDFYEEALGIAKLMEQHHLTQQQAAQKLGKTQSAIANKLRLLRLPADVIGVLRQNRLSERHARALLRLDDPALQMKAAQAAAQAGFTVVQMERYVEQLLEKAAYSPPKVRPKTLRDVRLFLNTLNRAVDLMRQAGVGANMKRSFEGDEMIVTIRIPAGESAQASRVSQ